MGPIAAMAASGEAVGVIPDAEYDLAGAITKLVVGSDVEIGQTVTTGASGQAELLFSDGTKLVVGPNSSLLIEDYLFRGDGNAGKLAIDALGGTFRFITGSMAKSSYEVNTPTGTIGIRGTIFELFVALSGDALVTLLEGKVKLCGKHANKCQDVQIEKRHICGVGFISLSETGFSNITPKSFGGYFPYLISQDSLRKDFRVDWAEKCFKELAEEGIPIVGLSVSAH
ncbi:MAG: FecR domain-containing protein [Devosia sp.]